MTDPSGFVQHVEGEVLSARAVAKPTCEAFVGLPLQTQIAYARAMRFLGCESVETPPGGAPAVPEEDRIRASRLMLLSLYLDTGTPAWSSWMLDRLAEAVMGTPGGGVGDLLHALHDVLGEYPCDFTEPMRNLIKALVVKSFTEHRSSYETADLRWMVEKTAQHSTPAQAYLVLHAVPPGIMQPKCAVAILRKLASTPYWEEAVKTLSDELNHKEAQGLLKAWFAEGVSSPCAEDMKRMLGLV
jgi:hypothetical protein